MRLTTADYEVVWNGTLERQGEARLMSPDGWQQRECRIQLCGIRPGELPTYKEMGQDYGAKQARRRRGRTT